MASQVENSNDSNLEKQLKIILKSMYLFSAFPLFTLGFAVFLQSVSSLNGYWAPQFSNLKDTLTVLFVIMNLDLIFTVLLMLSLMNSAEHLELKRSYGKYLQALILGESVSAFLLLINLMIIIINYQKINLLISVIYTLISIVLCLYATIRFKSRIEHDFS